MRKTELKRRTPLKNRTPLKRGTKRLRKVNPEREAKRRQQYRVKLSAYRRSETYKWVELRAGGRCERLNVEYPYWAGDRLLTVTDRCREYRPYVKLTHHHKTYARFGGKELPEDIIVLCPRHNAEAESQHPTRKRGRAA